MNNFRVDPFAELEQRVFAALQTYSNVHRGSGHFSLATTHLFEMARNIILKFIGLNKRKYIVVFCSALGASKIISQPDAESYRILSGNDFGVPFGIRAVALKRKNLPKGVPFQTGGGTARLIAANWVVWAVKPYKFEAGTPAIINIIGFAVALQMIERYGKDIFRNLSPEKLSAKEILYHDEMAKLKGPELLDEIRLKRIGRGISVPTTFGESPFINFDSAASTQTFTPVWDTFRFAWRQPNEVQPEIIQEVKTICAATLGAPLTEYDVIFTSNTTEAINVVAESLTREPDTGSEQVLLTTTLEHSSNDLPWRNLPGYSLIRLSVDNEGLVDLNQLEQLLKTTNFEQQFGKQKIKLVAVSGASNVLGTFNNLAEISRIVHNYGARLLVDAAQMVAHRKVDMAGWGIDYLAFSAHKVYAPFGSGVLVVRKGLLRFNPDEMETVRSSGEENVGGIAALGKALNLLQRIGMALIEKEELELTGKLLQGMSQIPSIQIYGITDAQSNRYSQRGSVIAFSKKDTVSGKMANELAIRGGIGVRYGCHCTHILVKQILGVGPGLEKFQRLFVSLFRKVELPGVARVSLGFENTREDVEKFLRILSEIAGEQTNPNCKDIITENQNLPVISTKEVKKQMADFVKTVSRRVYFQE